MSVSNFGPTPRPEADFSDRRFLIVDDNPEGRFLVSKTLLRKFPRAVITECQDAEAALKVVQREAVSLIVSHRTYDYDGVALVREFRKANATVPILMMSGIDRTEAARAAGANAFLIHDQWLLVGNQVAAMLATGSAENVRLDGASPLHAAEL